MRPPYPTGVLLSSIHCTALCQALKHLCWRRWMAAGACYIVWGISAGVQPWLVAAVIRNLETPTLPKADGYGLAFILFVATLGYSLAINHKFHQLSRMGVTIRSLLTSLVYEKGLRLHHSAAS